MASTAVLMHLNERATGDPARDWLSSWAHRYFVGDNLRVLVLGCGEGWLERAVSQWPYVAHIDAVDAAEEAVARARAQETPKVAYDVVDLNRATLGRETYDVVVAHSILHHVENLEHALEQIESAMKPDATLVINEYVGPNRFQFTDSALAIMNELLACLPAPLRRGTVEDVTYERKERPSLQLMLATDPTEAVRAQDVVPMVEKRFAVLERKPLGGTILMHLLYDIVQNFRWEDPHERGILELLCTFEGALIDAGAVSSDFMILAARKKGSHLPLSAYSRPLPPRSEAAKDVEPDPLGFGRRHSERRIWAGNALQPWMLRLLRIALASARPHRANLIAESRIRAAVEQVRYRMSGLTPFDWIRSRWAAHDDEPSIAALLDAFERIAGAHRLR